MGWYYDEQLNNTLTRVSLHPNMDLMTTTTTTTRDIPEIDLSKDTTKDTMPTLDPKTANYNENTWNITNHWSSFKKETFTTVTKTWIPIDQNNIDEEDDYTDTEFHYRKTPICTSVIQEDFTIGVTNEWSDFGGDGLGELWNGLRTKAPYGRLAIEAMKDIFQQIDNNANQSQNKADDDKTWSNKIQEAAVNGVNFINDKFHELIGDKSFSFDRDAFNRALITQGTRFSYYSGTNIGFGNLGMRFTLFPKWDGTEFKDVIEQANELYSYTVGAFEEFPHDENSNKIGDIVKDYLMWQKAPGGYQPDLKLKNIDVIQQGTLKLKIGTIYSIPNLVCSDMNVVFSRQLVKNPLMYEESTQNNYLTPLYCDVALNLKPVTRYSDNSLKMLVNKSRQSNIEKSNELVNNLKDVQ